MSTPRKKFSVIVPVYNNALNLPNTLPRLYNLKALLPQYDLEFVMVDDGSQDNSLSLLLDAQKQEPLIKVVKLTRNFGAVSAFQAGIKECTGDCACVIAADMQDPPELLAEMLQHWEAGKKLVLAVRTDREDPLSSKIIGNIFYALIRKFGLNNYPPKGYDLFIADRQVLQQINTIGEKNSQMQFLMVWLGYAYDTVHYVRQKRQHGKSQWTLFKKIKFFIDCFVSFSYMPIRAMSLVGFLVALISFLYGVSVVIHAIFMSTSTVPGWTTLIALITFLLGLIMVMLGIIGEYLWRILDETRRRPQYVIDEIYKFNTTEASV